MTSDLPVAPTSTNLADSAAAAISRQASLRAEHRASMRSATRGVGTTLYMSPEQRACRPYDHKVGRGSALRPEP